MTTTNTTTLPMSILTRSQTQTHDIRFTGYDGQPALLRVNIRWDDSCGNGHNSFSITGELYDSDRIPGEKSMILDGKRRYLGACGCVHDDIMKHAPRFADLIKWHLVSSDGPMYYLENTLYHVQEYGCRKGWVFFTEPVTKKEICLEYCTGNEWMDKYAAEGDAYRFEPDPKTSKTRDLNAARSCAVWPDATDAELTQEPEALKAALLARLPALLADFRAAVESLGFIW